MIKRCKKNKLERFSSRPELIISIVHSIIEHYLLMNEHFAIMIANIPEVCVLVLRKIFGNLEKYRIEVTGSGIKGEGYVSDMIFIDLRQEEKSISLLLKIMPDIKNVHVRESVGRLYDSEILFYEKIWPTLYNFQKDNIHDKFFDKIPKYFGSSSENGRRVLVLENLKASNFILLEKTRMYDKDLVELLFKSYGNYHALSLALKDKNRVDFEKLIDSIPNNTWNSFKKSSLIALELVRLSKYASSILVGDDVIKDKMNAFAERVVDEFDEVTIYKGDDKIVKHGDCWINNFMFNQNDVGDLQDIRFIDFQMVEVGTPIHDLSYLYYTGATKEILDELEHYLQVYHSSLSSKLREFGCDPDKVYSYDTLKREWKQYSKFGFMMAIYLWRRKTTEDIIDILDISEIEAPQKPEKFDEAKYAQLTGDLIRHMFDNDFI